jgi:hypothetical protein
MPAEFLEHDVTGSKWEWVFAVFEALHDGGSAALRTLRHFVGGWLEGRYHTPPRPDVRQGIVGLLAAQGWHVVEGRLIVGETGATQMLGYGSLLLPSPAEGRWCARFPPSAGSPCRGPCHVSEETSGLLAWVGVLAHRVVDVACELLDVDGGRVALSKLAG